MKVSEHTSPGKRRSRLFALCRCHQTNGAAHTRRSSSLVITQVS